MRKPVENKRLRRKILDSGLLYSNRAASGARPGFIRHMSGVDSRFIRGIRG
jgi:hypothetical protein